MICCERSIEEMEKEFWMREMLWTLPIKSSRVFKICKVLKGKRFSTTSILPGYLWTKIGSSEVYSVESQSSICLTNTGFSTLFFSSTCCTAYDIVYQFSTGFNVCILNTLNYWLKMMQSIRFSPNTIYKIITVRMMFKKHYTKSTMCKCKPSRCFDAPTS